MAMYGLPLCFAIIYRINKNMKLKRNMITENEVSGIIGQEFPEMSTELEKLPSSNNIYKTIECFVSFTKHLISEGNLKEAKHCFIVAEKMLENGNNTVKNAIENIYVYSLGTFVELTASTANHLKEIFNGSLRKEYHKHVMTNGI